MATTALLKLLAALNAPLEDGYESEVVREGRQCWLGTERISGKTLEEAIRCSAVENVSDGGLDRYVIGNAGKAILRRPELAEEILAAILGQESFALVDDRVAPMSALDAPTSLK